MNPATAAVTVLDGPLGTELAARGVDTPLPGWSAHALETAPDTVRAIHRDYAAAGARVHTANTFRTQPRYFPDRWEKLIDLAVGLAREATEGLECRVAGSMAPLEDCYAPERSPAHPRPEHRALATKLADAGVDLLLVETFPHVGEALIAVEEAVATGLPTWVSFTAGPDGDLLTPGEVRAGARRAVAAGASAVLVNCLPVARVIDYLTAIRDAGVPFGAYANAGRAEDEQGFSAYPKDVEGYARAAASWLDAGAGIVGGCCGTGVDHVRALAGLAS